MVGSIGLINLKRQQNKNLPSPLSKDEVLGWVRVIPLRSCRIGLPCGLPAVLSKAEPKTWVWEKEGLVTRRWETDLMPYNRSVVADFFSFVQRLTHK